jgi:polyferredoxin
MTPNPNLYQPEQYHGLLDWPAIGHFLRWRHGRLLGQLILLLVALLIIYDGFTGPQYAPENTATNIVWLQYRGFVMLALLLAGNLFCMNCPFTLPRSLARRWSIAGRRWPRALRNKWLAFVVLFLYLYLYEWLDLWASPWFTAWIVIAYFLLAFLLEFIFSESPFCKYICPLGTFNYIGSTVSPLQIDVASQDICRTCAGKECVNGRKDAGQSSMLGCGTELFPPQVTSNIDCTMCLDCARACPYDNVTFAARPLLHELRRPRAWPYRWDLSLLVWLFTFAALSNAFGMTPPIYATGVWLAGILNTGNEALLLLVIFAVLNILLPLAIGLPVAWIGRALAQTQESLRISFSKHTPALVPVAFAIWLAHYGFHFATGTLSIIPALQNFLIDHGLLIFGAEPNWTLSNILPFSWLLPLQVIIVVLGFGGSFYALSDIGRHEKESFTAQLPWLLLLLAIAAAAIYLFTLPMEMRGTGFMH